MQSISATSVKICHPILKELRINEHVVYSIDSSGKAFEIFLKTLEYSAVYKYQLKYQPPHTHKLFPKLEWLQNRVNEIGLIKTGQEIEWSSAKGTVYLYFLVLIGLLKIKFNDYFYTNPKTILKLDQWLEPYKQLLGIEDFVNELLKIAESTRNRSINSERQWKFGNKVGIYLVLRYGLKHIKELRFEQWQEFMLDCRNSRRHIQNASISLMHRTLLNMGVIEETYEKKLSGAKTLEKNRDWHTHPQIAPYYNAFMDFIVQSKAKGTTRHYRDSIEVFYLYLLKQKGETFSVGQLARADIVDFINYLYSYKDKQGNPYSFKWMESRSYNVKVFLRFISENAADFRRRGIPVFAKKIIVDKDFVIPQTEYLPRPIDESALNVLLESLVDVENKKYRLAFLLMLTTGLAMSDMLSLKYDCLKYEETTDIHTLYYYRLKTKKHVSVRALQDAIPIIKELQRMNTQLVPLPHPDGSDSIFLLNDGGNRLYRMWLGYWMKKHKEIARLKAPRLVEDINKLTPHKLRHTFASIMRDRGATITQLMELMGHTNIAVTQKYTKESDRLKIELIEKLQNGEYVCESLQQIDQSTLQGEQGVLLIESMLKHENRFSGGRCTVNGYENCKNAYRCLSCAFLCTTKEDLPEIVSLIKIQHLQYQEYNFRIEGEARHAAVASLQKDIERIKKSLIRLYEKYRKLQGITAEQAHNVVNQPVVKNIDTKGLITFV